MFKRCGSLYLREEYLFVNQFLVLHYCYSSFWFCIFSSSHKLKLTCRSSSNATLSVKRKIRRNRSQYQYSSYTHQQIGPLSSHTDIFQLKWLTKQFPACWTSESSGEFQSSYIIKESLSTGSIALNGASGQLLQSAPMSAAFLEGQYLKPCILLLCRAADKDMEYFII